MNDKCSWDAAYKEEYDGLVDIETWETKNGSIIPRTQKVRKRGDENPQKRRRLAPYCHTSNCSYVHGQTRTRPF